MQRYRLVLHACGAVATTLVVAGCTIQPSPVTVTVAPETTVTVTATPEPVDPAPVDPEAQAEERRIAQWRALDFRWSGTPDADKASICAAVAADVASVVEAQRATIPELDQAVGEEFFIDACA